MVNSSNKLLEIAVPYQSLLGESPVWDQLNHVLYWVDILKGDIHQFFPIENKHIIHKIGHTISAIALRKSGGFIAALKDGFAEIDIEKGLINYIVNIEKEISVNRFNDGKCDPAGRFWAGTMNSNGIEGAGSLYVLDTDLSFKIKLKNVTCSNGLSWSLDHKTIYYIDSPTNQVVAYDYDVDTGLIHNSRVVIYIPKDYGIPDGMTIDSEGMLWIACWDGWKLCRWNPQNGNLIYQFNLPVSRVTSCTFGGDNLQDLYVTSAKVGLSKEVLRRQAYAGALFVIKNSGFKGVPDFKFLG